MTALDHMSRYALGNRVCDEVQVTYCHAFTGVIGVADYRGEANTEQLLSFSQQVGRSYYIVDA